MSVVFHPYYGPPIVPFAALPAVESRMEGEPEGLALTSSHGPTPLVSIEQITEEQSKLEYFLKGLYDGSTSQEELRNRFYALSKITQDEFAHWIWVEDRCPLKGDYGKDRLHADFRKLCSITKPFLFHRGHNIVEQWMYCLQIIRDERIARSLRNFNGSARKPSPNLGYLKHLFQSLPHYHQDRLVTNLQKAIGGKWEDCKSLALNNGTYLLTKHSGSAHNILEELIAQIESELSAVKEQIKNNFLHILHHKDLTRVQKKHCYDRLHHEVKSCVPSYPFHGFGFNTTLYDTLGSHPCFGGTRFAVKAPGAHKVFVITTFDGNESSRFPMEKNGYGEWETFASKVECGTTYLYEIHGKDGSIQKKADPFAHDSWVYHHPYFHYESIVRDPSYYPWEDDEWMHKKRENLGKSLPMSIFKLHPIWQKEGERYLNYRELAHRIVTYLKDQSMGFTHVELSALLAHPCEGSQGYQPLNLFAVNNRHGNMYDLQYLVDTLHKNGIGVIVDLVANHFCVDDFGLRNFGGEPFFEHPDGKRGFHPSWGCFKYNFSNPFVREYIHSAAHCFVERFHIDGFRVDAVDSMLDMNNGRSEHECRYTAPDGSSVDPDAAWFLRDFTYALHYAHPGTFIIAESSGHRGMSSSYGFDAKQALGGMYDLKEYFSKDPIYRSYEHDKLVQAHSVESGEHVVYAFSHDQVSNGAGSLLHQMPGDEWQKFANLRLFYSFTFLLPGRKLMFMGDEIGEKEGWDSKLHRSLCDKRVQGVDWDCLKDPKHAGIQNLVRALNHIYRSHSALWDTDVSGSLSWIDTKDRSNSVVSFHRGHLTCVMNATPNYYGCYDIHFPYPRKIDKMEEIFNSDHIDFGGSGKTNAHAFLFRNDSGEVTGFRIQLPPLACFVLKEISYL